jgi:ABC-type sugar transport system permease subunit
MYVYQTAFESNDFNLASAAAVILFVVVLILTLVNFRSSLQREFSSQSGA